MNLKKFKEKDSKKKGIILFTICCVLLIAGVFFSSSFALFETGEVFNLISGNVKEMQDISFTYYVDHQIVKEAPTKTSGKVFDQELSSCTNEASVRWNYEDWSPVVTNWNQTKTKCNVHFKTEYSESILNGAYPVIKDELIPVTIEEDGTVKKADLSEEWYSYEKKNWANAVILKDETINYREKEIIPEENIESYFVWIPRYRYKIFNEGNYNSLTANVIDNQIESKAQEIEIKFENKDVIPSTGVSVGEWLTHPAFRSFDSNGMWVGKFETSKSNENPDNSINPEGIQIKPNVSSWRNIQVANAFYSTYDYKRNLESHMMKNTEWGGVAYLQHSNYGSHTSVRINNHSDYITGYAANNEPTCGYTGTNLDCNEYCNDGSCNKPYNTSTGYLASTTGNITGIYDMSGGAWEYVMGVMMDENGNLVSGRNNDLNSGFIGTLTYPNDGSNPSKTSWTTEDGGLYYPDFRYYDSYSPNSKDSIYINGYLGDATKEMGPFGYVKYDSIGGFGTGSGEISVRAVSSWYEDCAWFLYVNYPYFMRGGSFNDALSSGIFAYSDGFGTSHFQSFRTVLVI